jgi:hypothetical protein
MRNKKSYGKLRFGSILIWFAVNTIVFDFFAFIKTVSKAIRFWDFSYETVFETLLKKSENVEKGLCLLITKA